MITPQRGLFTIMLRSLSLSVRIQLVGGKPVGDLESVVNLSLGSPRTNPFSTGNPSSVMVVKSYQ